MPGSYVPNQTVMGLGFLALLAFAAFCGFSGWAFYWPPLLFIAYWIAFLKLMPEDDRRILNSAKGVMFGMFVGRGIVVMAGWAAGVLLRLYGPWAA